MSRLALGAAAAFAALLAAPAAAGTIDEAGVAFEPPAGFEDAGPEATPAGSARVLRGPEGARLQVFALHGPRLSARQLRGAPDTAPTPQGCVAVEAAARPAGPAACPGCIEERAIVVCEGFGAEVRSTAVSAVAARAAALAVVSTARRTGTAAVEAPAPPERAALALAAGQEATARPAAAGGAEADAAAAPPASAPAVPAPEVPWLPDVDGPGRVDAPLELPYDLSWGDGPDQVRAKLQGLLAPGDEVVAGPGRLVQRWSGELVDELGCDRVEAEFADGKLWALRALWPASPDHPAALRWEELIQRAAARHGRPAGFTSAIEVWDAVERRGQPGAGGRDRYARLDGLVRAGGRPLAPAELLTRWRFRGGAALVVGLGILPAPGGAPATAAASWLWLAPR